ncbi:MAG: aldo/keto reductase [Desulfobacteraceae bacterium]|nr:MAG: aldo/keto reductase [Desulfobacteraceae bacterium]
MKKRKLGTSGIEVSEIGFGTNYIGGHNLYEKVDEEEGVRLVRRAVDLGITLIDTADVYGMGRSEELVGKALKGRRESVVLATKGGIRFDGKSRAGVSNDPAYLREALAASLKRLGTDHIDLYYIHRPDGKTPPEEAFGALMRFKEEGLIRAAGVSNFELSDIRSALKSGPVDAVQSRYNLLQREVEAEILPFCSERGIGFIPWGPLAFGLLGGKYTRDFKLSEKDWRHRSGAFDPEVYDKNIETVEKLKEIAAEKSIPVGHLAVQWLLSKGEVASVIAGAKRVEQLEENAQADRSILSIDEIVRIQAMTHRGR